VLEFCIITCRPISVRCTQRPCL